MTLLRSRAFQSRLQLQAHLNVLATPQVASYAKRMYIASMVQDMFRVRLGTGKAKMNEIIKQF